MTCAQVVVAVNVASAICDMKLGEARCVMFCNALALSAPWALAEA